MIYFEWDPIKAVLNLRKHGVSFEEAQTVFFDDNSLLFDDPAHSMDEDRFLLIGMSLKDRVCIVSHCYRKDDAIRIISARKANSSEVTTYLKYYGG